MNRVKFQAVAALALAAMPRPESSASLDDPKEPTEPYQYPAPRRESEPTPADPPTKRKLTRQERRAEARRIAKQDRRIR